MLGIGLGLTSEGSLRRAAAAGGTWEPITGLGASLIDWWSADDHGTARMVDDGAGLISSWTGKVAGIAATGTTTARPTWAVTSFNSSYAGLTFDGTANTLASTSTSALPSGNNASEIWSVVNQAALVGDTTQRYVGAYGTATTATRRVFRAFSSPAIRVHGYAQGNFLVDTVTSFIGNFVVGVAFENLVASGRINGTATTPATAVLPTMVTVNARLRIGAMNDTVAATFWQGVIRHFMVTTALTALQRQQLEGWAAWDSGLQASLPVGHPYKSARP